ncbi:MAG: amidophosphoribosyltransferase [Candidatus Bathyarchaeia archaeon]
MSENPDYPKEACGIIGVFDPKNNVTGQILFGLMALQHRGQEAAGVAVSGSNGAVKVRKALGLVGEGFSQWDLHDGEGNIGIGHVRYSTVGPSTLEEAQPFYLAGPLGGIALAHNGNIVNYRELRSRLLEQGVELRTGSDAEILANIFAEEVAKTANIFEALMNLSKIVEGGYSVVCVTGNRQLLVWRDPHGFRPLCYGVKNGVFMCASESVAIDMCGGELVGDVGPGEAIVVSSEGVVRQRYAPTHRKAHCMFEYVYFSRPDSIAVERQVYDVRLRLGENLASVIPRDADVIVPVPDTSRPAAEGASRLTGKPVAEGLIKNRYVHRTFIMPDQSRRENAVKAKLNALKSVLKGQRIVLIDDSIVRGTTLKGIVSLIKKAGAREVHVRITCPKIIAPCFYGIDIATHRELIASDHSVDEIGKLLGADSLEYQTVEGLIGAIGLDAQSLCLACLTGKYPTPKAQEIADTMKNRLPVMGGRVRYIEVQP